MARPRCRAACLSFALLNKLDSVTPNWGSVHDFSRKPLPTLLHKHRIHTYILACIVRSHHDIPPPSYFYFYIPYFCDFTFIGYRLHNCAYMHGSYRINGSSYQGNAFVFVNFCCCVRIYTRITRIFTRAVSTRTKRKRFPLSARDLRNTRMHTERTVAPQIHRLSFR